MIREFLVPFSDPEPDFHEFRQVLEGKIDAERVHYAELFADREIVEAILADYMGHTPVPSPEDDFEDYWRQQIEYWHKMGYDYIRVAGGLEIPRAKHRTTGDTAELSRGERNWIEQGIGEIASWKDFEAYPWQTVRDMDFAAYEFVSQNLPDGMKMLVCPPAAYSRSHPSMLGFEGMSIMLYEDPELWKPYSTEWARCCSISTETWSPLRMSLASSKEMTWGSKRQHSSPPPTCASWYSPGTRATPSWHTSADRSTGCIPAETCIT